MTFSISARCARTGAVGVAVAGAGFAIGSFCPAVRYDLGVVTSQGAPNPALRALCLEGLAQGLTPDVALRQALARDPGAQTRQVGLMDAKGQPAAFTGSQCEGMAGYIIDADCVIAGNGLIGRPVLEAVLGAWQETTPAIGHAERLVGALEAGQRAGGSKRGRQSAVLLVGHQDGMQQVDLRVDDHREPLVELRRLLTLFRERGDSRHAPQAPAPGMPDMGPQWPPEVVPAAPRDAAQRRRASF